MHNAGLGQNIDANNLDAFLTQVEILIHN